MLMTTKNFWPELPKPFFCLAPMYDVTDAAFRAMFVRYSKEFGSRTPNLGVRLPNSATSLVLFTEFVSADGLASEAGRPKLLRELYYTEAERPIVAQIFGSNPATIESAVKLIRELGFDGVDINLGCPDRAVEKQGAGSALMKNPELAKEIILAAKRGASDKNGEQVIPVSVKTRLGYNQIDEGWWQTILEAKPDAVTFHLRTRKEMSDAPAHYEVLPKIVEMFKNSGIVLIANGDIQNVEAGIKLAEKYGLDGVMIGRGAFGRPDLFASLVRGEELRNRISRSQIRFRNSEHNSPASFVRKTTSGSLEVAFLTIEARLRMVLEHSQLFWGLYGPTVTNQKLFHGHQKNFAVMRKHFKAYVSCFKGATALRVKLMQANNPDEVKKIITDFLVNHC